MRRSEEIDLREGLIYDAHVKRYDSSFWQGDTANLVFDSVKNRIKVGDTGLVGAATSFSQYLYGDFEFGMFFDSLSPDSNDSVKHFGLRNPGDSDNRGAAYFDLGYDTTAGDSSPDARSLFAVVYSEYGTRFRYPITWDTDWAGSGRLGKFRINWEPNGYKFLINDTLEVSISEGWDSNGAEVLINTSIRQALRLSNRSLDSTDTSPMSFAYINIRHSRNIV